VHTEELNSEVKRERLIYYEAKITIIRWTGGQVGDKDDQDAATKRNLCFCCKSNPVSPSFQHVAKSL